MAAALLAPISKRPNKWRPTKKEWCINFALMLLRGSTYLEIGVRDGDCIRQIRAKRKIGIDPVRGRFGEERDGEIFFEMESDRFFKEQAPQVLKRGSIDVALVDGLHEFTQVMRDLAHLQPYMNRSGVIFIHDCNPATRAMLENRDGGEWTGDVWKAAHYLAKRRPDLSFYTLDCDYGVGVLQGFGTGERGFVEDSKELDAFKALDFALVEEDRRNALNLKKWPYFYYALLRFLAQRRP